MYHITHKGMESNFLYTLCPMLLPRNNKISVKQVVKVIWQKGRIAATHGQFSRICQVLPVCTHLIHASLKPLESTSQRTSWSVLVFCTAHSRMSLYFTMGRPFPLQVAILHDTTICNNKATSTVVLWCVLKVFMYVPELSLCNLHLQHMESEQEAQKAIRALNGHILNGNRLNVEVVLTLSCLNH